MTSDEIREAFLSYFESKDHLRVASSSLIPLGDPTLLLTNAGMVQFKPYFAGESTPPNRRLTSSQKSFRTVDIDEVGDATHATMFEMLGNFSIGDYFKDGAMQFAIECLEEAMALPRERFAATVHEADDDAYELWQKHGIPAERVFRFGDEDNWWGPAGDEGPTGPCAELHYDFVDERQGCGVDDCGPNCTNLVPDTGEVCQRYVELWNLVFMQYYQKLDGSRDPLPATGIDTGMGFERLVTVKQHAPSFYETDLFSPLLEKIEEASGKGYESGPDTKYAMRVMAEHARSATFLIADGVVPGNEGRGYVLRRVIRRAIRHGRRLGLEDPFLGDLARVVTGQMGDSYPELRNHQDFALTVLQLEEERFQQAFQKGSGILGDALKNTDTLSGEVVFGLWDTYGFPVEMTQEIARENGVEVDIEGFERHMEEQRQRARASASFGGDQAKIRLYESLGVGATNFLGYDQLSAPSVVVGLIAKGQVVNEVSEGDDEVEVVLVETPFYPEGGGQVGDAGELVGQERKIDVRDTQTVMPGLIVHFGKVVQGKVALGDAVDAYVDGVRREDTARNHTATHLLHAALRQVLGTHVRQVGSLVAPDRLRFDFSHVAPLSADEVEQVEWLVNEKVRENVGIHKDEDTYASAIERGALAFFDDKYDDTVRLVEIANGATFSFEVCGGTHGQRTGELGAVYVMGESSIGAGMRRIEAVSGRGAERVVRQRLNVAENAAGTLQTTVLDLEARAQSLLDEMDELRRANDSLERRLSFQSAEGLLELKQDVDGVTVLAAKVSVSNVDALRDMSDWLRDKMGEGVVVLGCVIDDSPTINVSVTPPLVEAGIDARVLARDMGKAMGGGGGGRAEMAQAGGRQPKNLGKALKLAPDLVRALGKKGA